VNKRTLAVCSVIALALVLGIGLVSISHAQSDDAGGAPSSSTQLSQTIVISPTAVVWQMLGQVDRNRVVTDLRRLR
jgi:hypothetical protein